MVLHPVLSPAASTVMIKSLEIVFFVVIRF
jgi:hypothetical protein